MFPRPVRLPTKPAPTSISGAISPLTVMLPLEGFEMVASSLSMVLLPAPLWPMRPTTLHASMLKLTSSSALNGARSSVGWPVSCSHWLSVVVVSFIPSFVVMLLVRVGNFFCVRRKRHAFSMPPDAPQSNSPCAQQNHIVDRYHAVTAWLHRARSWPR